MRAVKKILIIDDDSSVLALLRIIFEARNYLVYSVLSGEEGIAAAQEILPDLILCDIMMPSINGFEVKRILNTGQKTYVIPFIFLTGKSEMKDLREGMNLGADDYIIKPFQIPALLKAIETRLGRIDEIKKTTEAFSSGSKDEQRIFSVDDRILLPGKPHARFIKIGDIKSITAVAEYSNICLVDGSNFMCRKVLKEWELKLDKSSFLRIHRSTIVNLNFIDGVEFKNNKVHKVLLQKSNQTYPVSQRYSVKLKQALAI